MSCGPLQKFSVLRELEEARIYNREPVTGIETSVKIIERSKTAVIRPHTKETDEWKNLPRAISNDFKSIAEEFNSSTGFPSCNL